MPRAPSARSAEIRSSRAVSWAGRAARCQAGSEMRDMNAPGACAGRPATVSIRASAQEAEKP